LLELIGVLDEWRLDEISLWPEIWGKESIGLLQALEDSSAEVFSSSGLSDTSGINIIDTSESQDLLGDLSGNATGTSWGWDKSDDSGTALSLYLSWDGMDTTDSGSPVTSSDWNDVVLGIKKGTLNGNLDLLGDLDSNTNVTLSVTDSNNSLESGSLTGLSLLLDGKNAHNFIGKLVFGLGDKGVDDLGFLDWDGVSIDFLKGLDLVVLNKSSELGEWSPLFLESTSSSSSTKAASAASSASSSEASSSFSTSSASASFGWSGSLFWCSWCGCWGLTFHVNNVFFL